jgi:hypothetical protein
MVRCAEVVLNAPALSFAYSAAEVIGPVAAGLELAEEPAVAAFGLLGVELQAVSATAVTRLIVARVFHRGAATATSEVRIFNLLFFRSWMTGSALGSDGKPAMTSPP